jgi:SAM-dependent methyltransferase
MSAEEAFLFRGFDIPIDLCLLTGGGPDSFAAISDQHMQNLNDACDLRPGLDVLEVGCGIGRDAIPLIDIIGPTGSYIGVDVIGSSISWCKANIEARHPNFHFVHHDIHDLLHNPHGTVALESVEMPESDRSVDLVILQSVFTHMLPAAVAHYLAEFSRIVRPGGFVYATFFMVNDEILATARATNLTPWDLRFEHEVEPGVRINDPDHPTGAVAYELDVLAALVARAGLEFVAPIRLGAWSGHHQRPVDGQDTMVLGLRSS